MVSNYNVFSGNGTDFGHSWGNAAPVPGDQDVFTEPQLKYLLRAEPGTPLAGSDADGGNRGATVMYQIGRPGTLYGEEGWDEVTDIPLWPFPNEAVIKATMAEWTQGNDGKRGFCADGQGLYGGPITLSSYIWEYLGSPMPDDPYST